MVSANGQLVLVFNGEIYNHRSIRDEIAGRETGWIWRGHSDTETLLAALQLWGLEKTLPRLNGMFAFALWDKLRARLFLARDRIGEKPLYYGACGATFLFGSELKSLQAHPDWVGQINPSVLAAYFRHGYVPDPHCIFKGLKKLPPAHWVEVTGGQPNAPIPYWRLLTSDDHQDADVDEASAIDELESRLKRAVYLRMEADVPLGAFLSGGIDSSAVVALMQSQATQPVRTFTIGFDVPGFNEADHAKAVADHLHTDHTELYVSSDDVLAEVPFLAKIWDEPFADSSQIPTLLLSRLTRNSVTVALTGDAGDELFCGYNRYALGYHIHKAFQRYPKPCRRALAAILGRLPAQTVDRLNAMLPRRLQYPALGDRLAKLAQVLLVPCEYGFYRALVSQLQNPATIVPSAIEAETILSQPADWPKLRDFQRVMMYLDTQTYLPGDILTKVDRATMAVGLEARVPFLDHTVMQYIWTLPLRLKLRHTQTKWILRQILSRYVPPQLTSRPKMGFGLPIEHWLAGPLREWAEDLLSPSALADDGYVNEPYITQLWREHKNRRRRWHHQLWTVIMYRAWRIEQAERAT